MRSLFLVLVGLVSACSAQLDPARQSAAALISPDLVIADVYGGGGNSAASFNRDFVVVFNRGMADAPLTGVTLWYASQAGTFSNANNSISLGTGTLVAGGSLLVTLMSGGATGTVINDGDINSTSINLSASDGKLALSTVSLNGCGNTTSPCLAANWIDLVGWGGAQQSEGTAATGASSNTKALHRGALGCNDTGVNSADLALTTVTAPRSSATTPTLCPAPPDLAGADLTVLQDLTPPPDLTTPPDLTSPPDLAGYSLLLNEVKWNPSGADNGQEFIELLGGGTIPQYTYVISVDGDGTAAGRINWFHNLSGLTFGSNGLLLIKGATTTFAGVDAATTVVTDTQMNGSPLQNGTESVLVIHSPTPLTISAGTTLFTSFIGVDVFDAIAAADTTGTTFGGAAIPACPPTGAGSVDGASRIVGDLRPQTVAAWYAGQGVGLPTDQFLDKVSVCSSGPATFSMSPGRPNDMPQQAAPDLGAAGDMAQPRDLAVHDFATNGDLAHGSTAIDLAVEPDDLSVGGVNVVDQGVAKRDDGGCSVARGAGAGAAWPLIFGVIAALWLARRRSPTARN